MRSRITAIIVDDEPPARKLLRSLLAAHPEIEIAGEAADVATAVELCRKIRPDIVFLDIQMPRMDGFALLPKLKQVPNVIFVTAHERHAVRAFEVNAVDYLLKPVTPERLAASILRVVSALPPVDQEKCRDADMVALREDSRFRVVPVNEITHIEAEDNYTRVHLLNGPAALIRRTLSEWDALLPEETFARIDRSLLIRIEAVYELRSEKRDLSLLFLSGRQEPLELGRSASVRIRKVIEKL